jgi:alkylation response protein AidB-like acyl-CoA dehydrogenase
MLGDYNPEEVALIERVRAFVARDVLPYTRDWEREESFPEDIWTCLAEVGLIGLTWPKEKGGQGVSGSIFCEICRELAKGDPALAMNVAAVNALAIGHFEHFASEEQTAKYMPGILKGEIKLAWGLTEPDAGSDAKRVSTHGSAIPEQPGYYKLNGRKMFITNGGRADLIIVMAKMPEGDLSAFFLETAQPGFKVEKRIHTVGVSASNTVQFTLTDAIAWHTPCKFEDAIGLLHRGRLGIAAMALGIAEKAFELTVEYSKQREQFNRRLSDMQSVQNMIADSAVELEASRLLIQNGAMRLDLGLPIAKEAAMAKLFASETANRVTNRAIQVHGGRGMTRDFLVEKLWRDAKLTEIGEGASEIQRLVISKQVLR